MATNFPQPSASPFTDSNNQVWIWNGELWVRQSQSQGIGEAPDDGNGYMRKGKSWDAISVDTWYLGPHASQPLYDNYDEPVSTGQVYYDTGRGEMRFFDGTGWRPFKTTVNSVIQKEFAWIIAGSDHLAGVDLVWPDAYGNTEPNWIDGQHHLLVFIDGILQINETNPGAITGDYTVNYATNGITPKADVTIGQVVIAMESSSLVVSPNDEDASGFDFVVDEDDMISDSAILLPTQQSVKAYVDNSARPVLNISTIYVKQNPVLSTEFATLTDAFDYLNNFILETNLNILVEAGEYNNDSAYVYLYHPQGARISIWGNALDYSLTVYNSHIYLSGNARLNNFGGFTLPTLTVMGNSSIQYLQGMRVNGLTIIKQNSSVICWTEDPDIIGGVPAQNSLFFNTGDANNETIIVDYNSSLILYNATVDGQQQVTPSINTGIEVRNGSNLKCFNVTVQNADTGFLVSKMSKVSVEGQVFTAIDSDNYCIDVLAVAAVMNTFSTSGSAIFDNT